MGTQLLLTLMTSAVLLARFVPGLKFFLIYGKTQIGRKENTHDFRIVQWISGLYVPKRYFLHFYVISFTLSLSLLIYSWLSGARQTSPAGLLFTILLAIQGLRRTLESWILETSHQNSVIHISHYIVGVLFYVLANVVAYLALFAYNHQSSRQTVCVSLTLFVMGSVLQFLFHRHLSALVKYSLPTFSLFKIVACPHYLAEIMIYAALIPVVPSDLRQTMLMLVFWIVTNLSISADQTLEFYRIKFDTFPPYAIIPYVY